MKPRRTFLDRAEHFEVLLDAAATLDTGSRRGGRRALLAVYLFSGLRADEALSLRWRDVRLADGTLTVTASKTEAGVRTVDLLPVLRDELLAHRATRSGDGPSAYVFGTSTGGSWATPTSAAASSLRPSRSRTSGSRNEDGASARGLEPPQLPT